MIGKNLCNAIILLFVLGSVNVAVAQRIYGNEWIEPGKSYLRIPVTQTGFYHITPQDLEKAGISPSTVYLPSLQLFRRGKELAIEVKSIESGALSYIGFYGQRNDGMLDTALYVPPAVIPHTYYSLYSDTSAYFLTWQNSDIVGRRISEASSPPNSNLLNSNFAESILLYNRFYAVGNFYPATSNFDNGSVLSTYDTGEGWTGDPVSNGSIFTTSFTTTEAIRDKLTSAIAELTIVGRSAGNHQVDIMLQTDGGSSRKITTISIPNYDSKKVTVNLSPENLLADGSIKISIIPQNNTGSVSLSLAKLTYPQKSSLPSNQNQKEFLFDINGQPITWDIQGYDGWRLYDISDVTNVKSIAASSEIVLDDVKRLIAVKQPLSILTPRLVKFADLKIPATDYLIVSHSALRKLPDGSDPVADYAAYRKSVQGGNYNPLIINIDDVFNTFNYGEPGPLGLRNMIAWFHKNTALRFVFLIGHGTDPQSVGRASDAWLTNMIPNAGWPGSDLALSMNLEGSGTYIPLVPVGRLNASKAQQVRDYLDKVKKMEAQPRAAAWRKNLLHLSGGRSIAELSVFKEYINSFENKIKNASLGASVTTISKKTDEAVEEFPIYKNVNEGIGLITMFGHSSVDVTDIDIGYVSDDRRQYANEPFFPAILVNGCASGSIFYSNSALSNDWILSPNRGAVLFLAHTFNGISANLKHYTDSFYDVLADSAFVSQPFGTIQKEAIRRNLQRYPNLLEGITAQQMVLHGDPAIRVFPAKLPDYTIQSGSVTFGTPSGKPLTAWSDSISVSMILENNGRFRKENYDLTIKRRKNSSSEIVYQYTLPSPQNAVKLNLKIPNSFPYAGAESWNFSIDPNEKLTEEDKSNNSYQIDYLLPEGGASPLLPANGFTTSAKTIELVAEIPSERKASSVVFEWSENIDFKNSEKKTENSADLLAKHSIQISINETRTIYWRVYIKEDAARPSQARSFTYNPDAPIPEVLPELIVYNQSIAYPRILEGGNFQAKAKVSNITAAAFKDSVTVRIRHFENNNLLEESVQRLVISGQSSQEFLIDFPTLNQIGEHRINLLFNASKLPEVSYSNNETNFTYKVYPDEIPPVLTVQIDSRQLIDNDAVSPSPNIKLQIIDENPFKFRTDTTGIEVWLRKDCDACTEKRIYLAGGQPLLRTPNNYDLELPQIANLEKGRYHLRVEATDMNGNRAAPYHINFRITDEAMITDVGVSPNPSSYNFHFFADIEGLVPPSSFKIDIYNQSGVQVYHLDSKVHLGRNEWIWRPDNLPTGIYIYKMKTDNSWQIPADVQKRMNGKIIWSP